MENIIETHRFPAPGRRDYHFPAPFGETNWELPPLLRVMGWKTKRHVKETEENLRKMDENHPDITNATIIWYWYKFYNGDIIKVRKMDGKSSKCYCLWPLWWDWKNGTNAFGGTPRWWKCRKISSQNMEFCKEIMLENVITNPVGSNSAQWDSEAGNFRAGNITRKSTWNHVVGLQGATWVSREFQRLRRGGKPHV